MTFSFTAAGRADEIVRQVRSHHLPGEADGLAHKVRELLTETFRQITPADEYLFVVKASGHAPERPGDYTAISLHLTVELIWIPRMREEPVELGAEPGHDV